MTHRVTFAQQGTTVAAAERCCHIETWNLATETQTILPIEVGTYGGGTRGFSPDGAVVAVSDAEPYVGTGLFYDTTIYLSTLHNGELLAALQGHRTLVRSVAFSQDGSLLVSGDGNGMVHLWQVPELEE